MIEIPHYLNVKTQYRESDNNYLCVIEAKFANKFTYHSKKKTVLYIILKEDELVPKLQRLIATIELETRK